MILIKIDPTFKCNSLSRTRHILKEILKNTFIEDSPKFDVNSYVAE